MLFFDLTSRIYQPAGRFPMSRVYKLFCLLLIWMLFTITPLIINILIEKASPLHPFISKIILLERLFV